MRIIQPIISVSKRVAADCVSVMIQQASSKKQTKKLFFLAFQRPAWKVKSHQMKMTDFVAPQSNPHVSRRLDTKQKQKWSKYQINQKWPTRYDGIYQFSFNEFRPLILISLTMLEQKRREVRGPPSPRRNLHRRDNASYQYHFPVT